MEEIRKELKLLGYKSDFDSYSDDPLVYFEWGDGNISFHRSDGYWSFKHEESIGYSYWSGDDWILIDKELSLEAIILLYGNI